MTAYLRIFCRRFPDRTSKLAYNEQEMRFYLIDPVLRTKGYDDHQWLKLETPAPAFSPQGVLHG